MANPRIPDLGEVNWDGDFRSFLTREHGADGRHDIYPSTALLKQNVDKIRRWIRWLDGNPGVIGEIGWPNSNPTNLSGIDHRASQSLWNTIGEAVYRELDKADAWIIYFQAGARDMHNHHMAAYRDALWQGPIDTIEPNAEVIERYLTRDNGAVQRGITLDARDWLNNLFESPTLEEFQFVANRGMTITRPHVPMKHLYPVLSQPMDSTVAAKLDTLMDRAEATGIGVILMLNWDSGRGNPAEYLHLDTGAFTQADLLYAWREISDRYKNHPALVAYEIGNEPHTMSLIEEVAFVDGEISWRFAADDEGWVTTHQVDAGSFGWDPLVGYVNAGSLGYTTTATVRGYRDCYIHSPQIVATTDNMARCYVRVEPLAGDNNWFGKLVQTRAGVVIASGPNYNFKPANGDWRNVAAEFPDLQPGDRIRVIVGSSNMNPGTWRIWVDDVTTGAAEAIPVPGRRHWEIVSQNVVDDIRAHGDATHLIIPTYNWASTSVHLYHPNGPWIVDPLNNFRYDSHVYFDGSSGYGHPYSYYNDNARAEGFQDSLAPRLADLYDVRIVNPQDGQRLVYDAATGYWKNG